MKPDGGGADLDTSAFISYDLHLLDGFRRNTYRVEHTSCSWRVAEMRLGAVVIIWIGDDETLELATQKVRRLGSSVTLYLFVLDRSCDGWRDRANRLAVSIGEQGAGLEKLGLGIFRAIGVEQIDAGIGGRGDLAL